jgi:hypothetical protein
MAVLSQEFSRCVLMQNALVAVLKNCGNHKITSGDQASCYLTLALEAATLSLGVRGRLAASRVLESKQEGVLAVFLFVLASAWIDRCPVNPCFPGLNACLPLLPIFVAIIFSLTKSFSPETGENYCAISCHP